MGFLLLNLGEIIDKAETQSKFIELIYCICAIMDPTDIYTIFSQDAAVVIFLINIRNISFLN